MMMQQNGKKNETKFVKTRGNGTKAITCKQKWSENVSEKCQVRTMCIITKIYYGNTIKLTSKK